MRPVAWISCASGAIAAVGVVFLAAMFASFAVGASSQALRVGRINDVLVMVSYLLAVPSTIALGTLVPLRAPALRGLATVIGIGALARSLAAARAVFLVPEGAASCSLDGPTP